jgi:hypothetical protein
MDNISALVHAINRSYKSELSLPVPQQVQPKRDRENYYMTNPLLSDGVYLFFIVASSFSPYQSLPPLFSSWSLFLSFFGKEQ